MTAPVTLPVGQVDPNPPLPPSVFVNAALGNGDLTTDQQNTIYQYVASRTGETVAQVQTKFAQLTTASNTSLNEALSSVYIGLVQGKTSTAFGAPGSSLPTVPTISNPLTSVESFLSELSNGNTWIRVAEFGIGFLMVGIAVAAIIKQSTGTSPANAVKKLSPIGAASSLVKSKPARPITTPKPTASASVVKPSYEGRHDRYTSRHGVDLSAPVL